MPKGSDLLVTALENEGVDRIFGVPGEENLDVVESLRGSRIRLVLTRHEQPAAFMAATQGRLTGRPGVCPACWSRSCGIWRARKPSRAHDAGGLTGRARPIRMWRLSAAAGWAWPSGRNPGMGRGAAPNGFVRSRWRRRALASTAALAVAAFAASASGATPDQPWKVLPPMPDLPAAMVSGPVHVNGIALWRAEFGPPDGKPVVMLHGGLANANYFGAVIPFLVGAGFHVVAVDSRGHGRSTRSAQPYSYELMASDVAAVLDALRIPKADLVGWSDGGIIGIVMALRCPERLRRVFAFGANTSPDGLIPGSGKGGAFAAFEKRAGAEYRQLSPTPGEFDSFKRQLSRMWATQPRIAMEQLRTIRTPIVIADGRYDEIIKQSHNRAMAGAIPGGRLVILPGVSHFATVQNPPLFARAVLDALTAPPSDRGRPRGRSGSRER